VLSHRDGPRSQPYYPKSENLVVAMSKKIKELELAVLRKSFAGVKDYVLLEPIKVDAGTEYEFRKKLRTAKVSVKLVKNSFARKILAENGVDAASHFSGPTLLCWGGDSVKGLANSVDTAVKESKKDPKAPDKFKVKTAIADGQMISLDTAKTLPTRLEAIGDVLGGLLGAGSSIASCLIGPASQLASILKTIEEKTEAPAAAA
jgi:large subunit ribosomal protein L10